ncbi:hypothetical protein LDENG_00000490 [Lucifuga dentata]|nr:hypothetical protein LDENG_00000490 [Lucifuga dentata]
MLHSFCPTGLQSEGVESPKVFLISNRKLHLYDFHHLQETFERELPAHKRDALLYTMSNISLQIIKKKKEAFGAKIKYYAIMSAGIAAVPVPGLSLAVDIALLLKTVKDFQIAYGLNYVLLQKLADNAHVPLSDLKAVMKSPLGDIKINKEALLKILALSRFEAALTVAKEGLRFIPGFGIPLGMVLSFTSTYRALNIFLNMLAEDAQNVFRKALGLNTSV